MQSLSADDDDDDDESDGGDGVELQRALVTPSRNSENPSDLNRGQATSPESARNQQGTSGVFRSLSQAGAYAAGRPAVVRGGVLADPRVHYVTGLYSLPMNVTTTGAEK